MLSANHLHQARFPLPQNREQQIAATIGAMEALRDDALERSQLVHLLAARLAATSPRNGHLQALYQWCRDHIAFKHDARPFEVVRHPDQLIIEADRWGRTAADCDDLATLTSAAARALGYDTAFVVVGTRPQALQHVFTGIETPAALLPFDPQERTPIGTWDARIARVEIFR